MFQWFFFFLLSLVGPRLMRTLRRECNHFYSLSEASTQCNAFVISKETKTSRVPSSFKIGLVKVSSHRPPNNLNREWHLHILSPMPYRLKVWQLTGSEIWLLKEIKLYFSGLHRLCVQPKTFFKSIDYQKHCIIALLRFM